MRWEKRLEADENLKISACKMYTPIGFLTVRETPAMYYELFRGEWKPTNQLNKAFLRQQTEIEIKFFRYIYLQSLITMKTF